MADFESNKQDENTTHNAGGDQSIQGHIDEESTATIHAKTKTNLFAWKIGVIVLIAVIALIYSTVDVEFTDTTEVLPVEPTVLDDRLYACNKVMSAEPSDNFNTCLSAAKDGEELAIKRLIWAYSRSNEYKNWSEVFNWIKSLPRRDESVQLSLYAIVHFMASSDELIKDSEEGISRLVAKNFPPANILLASIYALEENVLPPTSNVQWLLERESNEEYNAISPTQKLLLYANGFVGNVDIEKGSDFIEQVVKRDYPINANNIAWFLSTLQDNPFTTKEYVLSLIKQITDDPEYAQNPIYVDTLAAALASSGMFDEAIKTQQEAIRLLDESAFSEQQKNVTKPEFESRLALYSKGLPLVEETISVDKAVYFAKLKSQTVDYLFRKFFITVDEPIPSNNENVTTDKPVVEETQAE